MIGVSGVFGTSTNDSAIDNKQELADTVENITGGIHHGGNENEQYDMAAAHYAAATLSEFVRRVRLLTVAVVVIALYLVLKEA